VSDKTEKETRPVLFITYSHDDPDEANVLDVSGSLEETREWMRGRSGYVYRVERLPDGSYGNDQFIEFICR
jgi:hypothetical protein